MSAEALLVIAAAPSATAAPYQGGDYGRFSYEGRVAQLRATLRGPGASSSVASTWY